MVFFIRYAEYIFSEKMIDNNAAKRIIRCSWREATVMNNKGTDNRKNKYQRLLTNLDKEQWQDNDR